MSGVVTGPDGLARCPWATDHPVNLAYHDAEWGVRIQGEAAYFERLTLEAFQSGLSWLTILNKREAFREVFAGFDAEVVAGYGGADAERLLGDARIVRNRRKVEATIGNARAVLALRTEGGLAAYVEGFVDTFGQPTGAGGEREAPTVVADVPAATPCSTALSRELKRRGFAHVGPTTMYALMQATGLVDDHLAGCHRRGRSAG